MSQYDDMQNLSLSAPHKLLGLYCRISALSPPVMRNLSKAISFPALLLPDRHKALLHMPSRLSTLKKYGKIRVARSFSLALPRPQAESRGGGRLQRLHDKTSTIYYFG